MDNELATKTEDIKSLIVSAEAKKQFSAALPKHLKPDRFIRIALTALNKNPKLLACTKESLFSCLLDLSQLGLEPDGRKAHLIPYGDKCTLIIDYKGLVELARRSREIADIHADVVYDNDFFEYSFGSEGKLEHKPTLKEKGNARAAYSFVRLKDGSSSYEVMNIEEIEAIHKRSKAGTSGPWVTDWAEMAKKTVFRRHSKWLPVASEYIQLANEKDYDIPIDISAEVIPKGKPEVAMPKAKVKPEAKAEAKPEAEIRLNEDIINLKKARSLIGNEAFNNILGTYGCETLEELSGVDIKRVLIDAEKVYKKDKK